MALTGDHSNAVDERNYFGRILFLEFDFRVEQLEPLDARLAAIIQHQVLAMPAFLRVVVLISHPLS